MTTGPTFEDCCPQRRSEPEWPDVEAIDKRALKYWESKWIKLTRKEWRQIKSLLERVK